MQTKLPKNDFTGFLQQIFHILGKSFIVYTSVNVFFVSILILTVSSAGIPNSYK